MDEWVGVLMDGWMNGGMTTFFHVSCNASRSQNCSGVVHASTKTNNNNNNNNYYYY